MKRIVITGATGSIGRRVSEALAKEGNQVCVFTRNIPHAKKILPFINEFVEWDYRDPSGWKKSLEETDVIIHLAGANLNSQRWNSEFKQIAYESRVESLKKIIEETGKLNRKPEVIISASAVGYYGNRGDEILTEEKNNSDNYLGILCRDWENAAAGAEKFGIRWIALRTGLVLERDEGLMKKLLPAFRFFAGGTLGNGMQWFPWIHIDDICGIYLYSIKNNTLDGAVNAASPGIIRMKEFAKVLGKILNRPVFFKIPRIALRVISGELGNYATDSQRVSVEKLLNSGYKFRYEQIEAALKDLIKVPHK